MSSVSRKQRRLMGWAYSCKIGKNTHCPEHIRKLANGMKQRDLRKFAKTKHSNLPETIMQESITFDIVGTNTVLLELFSNWLDVNNIDYTINDNNLTICTDCILESKLFDLDFYIDKLGLQILEDVASPTSANMVGSISNDGGTYATLANTVGMGNVNPPYPGQFGSGDRFDNLPAYIKKKKKEEEEKRSQENDPLKFLKNINDNNKQKKDTNKRWDSAYQY